MAPHSRSFFKTTIEKLPFQNSTPLFLVCLAALLLSNILLSYYSLSPGAKIQLVVWGLALPLFLIFRYHAHKPDLFKKETLPFVPKLLWILLIAIALFARFYRLSSLSSWPVVDEGVGGYFAIRLDEHWDWGLLQGPSQAPRLYTWFQSGLFKLWSPSLFSLWLLPALWAALTLPAAWITARAFFSRSISSLFLFLIAFGTWPLLLGRYSTQSVMMVFWECLCLGLLVRFLKPSTPGIKVRKALLLGTATGIGFYTYLSWPLVALMIAAAVLASTSSKRSKNHFKTQTLATKATKYTMLRQKSVDAPLGLLRGLRVLRGERGFGIGSKNGSVVLAFFVPALAFLLPWVFALSREYRGYFDHLWNGSWTNWADRLSLGLSYFKDLFWGAPGAGFRFGPVWGGLLDPVTTTFFFLGLIALLQTRRDPRARWILAALVLFFTPAVLTNNFEMMRLSQLAPLLLLVSAFGASSLLSRSGPSGPILAAALLLLSCAFDLHHLFDEYSGHWQKNISYYGNHKSVEFEKAFRLLEERYKQEGPGLVLLNFNPDPYDQTLFVATYAFNAAENPGLDPAKAQWAAVLTNVHEEPFFKRAFPNGTWAWLSEGLGREDGGFMLETIPLTPGNSPTLARWDKADRALKELTHLVMELGVDPDQTQMLEVLRGSYPFFQGDRFLESRFWRITALHHLAEGKMEEAVLDEGKALERGYPMAHLYNELGCLLFKEKRIKGSEEVFRKAIQCRPNCTDAEANLKALLGK